MSVRFHNKYIYKFNLLLYVSVCLFKIQGDSLARGPKLLSIKNCVIEIMT